MKLRFKRGQKSCADGAMSLRLMAIMIAVFSVLALTLQAQPVWWTSQGAVNSSLTAKDSLAANQGQLKLFTSKAVQELNANLVGGAGPILNGMVTSWQQDYQTQHYTNTAPFYKVSDFQAVNVGQLKYIAKPLYSQLITAGYTNSYPAWLHPNPSVDSNMANLGQLKTVFNFDVRVPQNVNVVYSTSTQATISWSSAWSAAPGFTIQGSTNGTTWTTLATAPAGATSAALTLAAGTAYQFRVVANGPSGSTATSAATAAVLLQVSGGSTAPAALTLSATIGSSLSGVTSVSFYEGTQLLGTDTATPYTLNLTNIFAGRHCYSVVAAGASGSLGKGSTSCTIQNPFNQPPQYRYTRGSGSDATYLSSVIAIDHEQGLRIHDNDASQFTSPLPWFMQLADEETTYHHISPPDSSGKPGYTNDYTNPIVAFGQSTGGAPLYTHKSYRFGITAGTQGRIGGDIVIQIYSKSKDLTFTDGNQKQLPLATATISLPQPGTQQWDSFVKDGYVADVHLTPDGSYTKSSSLLVNYSNNFGQSPDFDTKIQFVTGQMIDDIWGQDSAWPLYITHTSGDDTFEYKVNYKGFTSPPLPQFVDGAFEEPNITGMPSDRGYVYPDDHYVLHPVSKSWTFAGEAILWTIGRESSTPSADGGQGLLLQGFPSGDGLILGSASQVINFPVATSAAISFKAALRPQLFPEAFPVQPIKITVDGQQVGPGYYSPTSLQYQTFVTPTIAFSPGNHTIKFEGTDNSADKDTLIDNVEMVYAGQFGNGGFETPDESGNNGNFNWVTSEAAPWIFHDDAIIFGVGSESSVAPPEGVQAALLQCYHNNTPGSFSQIVNFPSDTMAEIGFSMALRGTFPAEPFNIKVDGTGIGGTFTPTSTNYYSYWTPQYHFTAGNHTITFTGLSGSAQPNSDLDTCIDSVFMVSNVYPMSLTNSSDPINTAGYNASYTLDFTNPDSIGQIHNGGFETPDVSVNNTPNFVLDPVASPWNFQDHAIIFGVGDETSLAPPEGRQAALLQLYHGVNPGKFSQEVTFPVDTDAEIQFSMATRTNFTPLPFNVQVDGTQVGPTYTPATNQYVVTLTPSVHFTAGIHTITFAGTGSSNDNGDKDTFIDAISLNFAKPQAWVSTYLASPHFAGQALPSTYAGKSVDELLKVASPVTYQFSAPNATFSAIGDGTAGNPDPSPELRYNPILDKFVQDMNSDPIALTNYVLNKIHLTDAVSYNDNGYPNQSGTYPLTETSINQGGVNRGALATFLEKEGNPAEQCALLIYFLRKCGVQCGYVFPPHNSLLMLDARMSAILQMQLHGGTDPTGANTSVPQLINVNYPWVGAYVGGRWIHLFPWLKDTSITEGLDVADYLPDNNHTGLQWLDAYVNRDTSLLPSTTTLGTTTSGGTQMTSMISTGGIYVGCTVESSSFAAGTVVISVDSATQVTVSNPALNSGSSFVTFRQTWPQLSATGTTSTSSSPTHITGLSTTTGVIKGSEVISTAFPSGTQVVSIDSPTQVTVSKNALSTGSALVNFSPTASSVVADNPGYLYPIWLDEQLSAFGLSTADVGVEIHDRQNNFTTWSDMPQPWQVTTSGFSSSITASGRNIYAGMSQLPQIGGIPAIFDTIECIAYSDQNGNQIWDVGEPKLDSGVLRSLDFHNRRFMVREVKTGSNAHSMQMSLEPQRPNTTGSEAFPAGGNMVLKQLTQTTLVAADDQLKLRLIYNRHRALPSSYFFTDTSPNPLGPTSNPNVPVASTTFLNVIDSVQMVDERPFRKGDVVALCLNFGRVTQDMIDAQAQQFWSAQQYDLIHSTDIPAATMDSDTSIGTPLYLMGLSYYKQVSDFRTELEAVQKQTTVSFFASGLSRMSPQRNSNGTLPNSEVNSTSQP